ncbi:dynein alpha chain, flagellar outer arm, partial [Haematococcus lacustris]
ALKDAIETSLPSESPVVYGMHPNAELSLLTSLGETLFKTVQEVHGEAARALQHGRGGAAGQGQDALCGRRPARGQPHECAPGRDEAQHG